MIWQELKKIWRPKVLLIVLAVSALLYMRELVRYYNGAFGSWGEEGAARIQMDRWLVEQYGTSLSDAEYEDLCERVDAMQEGEERKELEFFCIFFQSEREQLQTFPTREDFIAYCSETNFGDEKSLSEIYWIEQEAEWLYGEEEAWRNIMFYELQDGTASFFSSVLAVTLSALCILLSPLVVYDRKCKIRPMQYSSRTGRRVLWAQFAAVMLSAVILTTIYEGIFGGAFFLKHGLMVFGNNRMCSFNCGSVRWINCTYFQYTCLLVLLTYLFCAGAAGILFFLSCCSKTYVGMIVKILPLLFLTFMELVPLLKSAFMDVYNGWFVWLFEKIYKKGWLELLCFKWAELILAGIVLLTGVLLGIGICLWMRKKDIEA